VELPQAINRRYETKEGKRVLGNGVTAICDDMVKNIGIESLFV
jgi:hypothetical protein